MAITSDEAIAAVTGAAGGGVAALTNIIDVGNDNGRGPGTPGGRGTGNTGVRPSGRGVTGAGYGEEDIAAILRGMPAERIAAIQKQMQVTGLLPDSFRSYGFVDASTRSAFAEVLDLSNDRGANWQTTLDGLEQAGKEALDEARRAKARAEIASYVPNPRVYNQSDPEAVKQTAEAAFKQALGRKPKPEELARFVKTWQAMEFSEQEQNFNAQEGADRFKFDAAQQAAGGGLDPVDKLLDAIGGQESGGDYNARNGRTGASGKYQIMPANWPEWSAAAGLGKNAPRTPENQEKVARFKMGQYVEQFGQEGAAVAWYAGPAAAQKWLKNRDAPQFNKKQGKGNEPSINEYVQQVMGRMGGGASGGSESDVLWQRLQQMVADSPYKIGLGPRTRSYEEQVAAKEREKRGGPKAATPGRSKHGDGRANDLNYYGNEKARQWVLANAARYGLHFPIYDPKKPRHLDESWHVELKDGHTMTDGHNHGGGGGAAPSYGVQQADLGAQAIAFAEQVNPDEKAAYDIGGQFNNFVSILQRGVI